MLDQRGVAGQLVRGRHAPAQRKPAVDQHRDAGDDQRRLARARDLRDVGTQAVGAQRGEGPEVAFDEEGERIGPEIGGGTRHDTKLAATPHTVGRGAA